MVEIGKRSPNSCVSPTRTLIYASCQRPEDCLRFCLANIKRIEKDGREIRVLRVRQAKTGKSLDIELNGELDKLINECLAEAVRGLRALSTRYFGR